MAWLEAKLSQRERGTRIVKCILRIALVTRVVISASVLLCAGVQSRFSVVDSPAQQQRQLDRT
jgi:hypothetical protein